MTCKELCNLNCTIKMVKNSGWRCRVRGGMTVRATIVNIILLYFLSRFFISPFILFQPKLLSLHVYVWVWCCNSRLRYKTSVLYHLMYRIFHTMLRNKQWKLNTVWLRHFCGILLYAACAAAAVMVGLEGDIFVDFGLINFGKRMI